ncbi:MAG: InlB B-repeat-containing protein [Clostridia bacterium]|nr:InlB B-repeat-containing protein [Clostridia bacterium]MBQ3160897.1 InlB B-repeat-containing protein [Oscillospiraceae bacterium]
MKTLKKALSIVLSFIMVFTTLVFFNPIKAEAMKASDFVYGTYYYYPSGTQFISDIKITQQTADEAGCKDKRVNASNGAKNELINAGYTILGTYECGSDGNVQMTGNLTQRKDEAKNWTTFTFLGYKTTTDITKAYTGIRARHDGSSASFTADSSTYTCLSTYDLNKSIGGDTIYLFATKDEKAGMPISELRIYNDNDDTDTASWAGNDRLVYKGSSSDVSDLNLNTSNTNYIYMAYGDYDVFEAIPTATMKALYDQITRYEGYTDISKLQSLDSTKYTTLVNAYNSATTIYNAFNNKYNAASYTKAQVESATTTLKNAFEAFVVTPDYSALNAKVAEANPYLADTSLYTVSTAAALSKAVTAGTLTAKTFELKNYTTAQAFIDAYTAEQNKINASIQPIEDAMQALATQITFDTSTNGGENNVSPLTVTVGKNTSVTVNLSSYTGKKTNYDFLGWSTDPDATTGSTASVTVPLATTFYAIFAISKYTLALDGNGATEGSYTPSEHEFGADLTFPTGMFKKTGYRVLGWSTDKNATSATYANGATVDGGIPGLASGATATFYVVWTPIKYKVEFNGNGAEGSMSTKTYTYDTAYDLPENTFTKEGGIFKGWSTNPDATEAEYTDGQQIINLSATNNSTITLYAVWDIAKYTVAYKGNGADEGADYSETHDVSDSFTLPTEDTFKKTGYTLVGWATSVNATEAEYEAGATVKNLTETNGATVTLYAVWEKAVYTVTFVFANNMKTVATYGYGDTVVIPANSADNYDDNNHYTYSWPTVATTATASVTYNEIKTGEAHDLSLSERLAPTCSVTGYEKYVCDCGYEQTIELEEAGHDYEASVTYPTCTQGGYTTYTCSKPDCDKGKNYTYIGDIVPALGHSPKAAVKENITPEDCGNDGYYEDVVYCSVCGEELSRTPVVVPATGNHSYNATQVQATCTEPGGTKYECSVCGDVYYDVTEQPLGHNWAATTYSFAEDGKSCTAERVCQREGCGLVETAEAEITSEETTAPTCTVDGWTTYTATFDVDWAKVQTKTVQDIPALGHSWHETTYKFASDGSTCTATRICKTDASHVEKAEADVEAVVKTAATCTTKGWTTYTATFEEDWAETQVLELEDIAALGHTKAEAVQENYKAPTCTEKGSYESVVYCSVCNVQISRKLVSVARLGHDWGEATYTFAEDGSACTATRVCKTDATHVETLEATITSEVTKAPSCDTTGDTTYTAHFYASWTENQTLTVVGNVPAAGHKEDRFTKENEVPATCNTPGSYTKVINCMVCGEEISRTEVTVPATGDHNEGYTERVQLTVPTCGDDGAYKLVVYCTECGEVVSSKEYVDPATGKHTPGEVKVENATDPACGVEGSYDNVVYCTVCNDELSRETITIPATQNHVPVDEGVVTPPTCTEDGYTTLTCSVCTSEYKVDIVPATGHTEGAVVVENEVDATCSAEGSYDNVVYCTVCDTELSRETVTVEKLPHTEEAVAGYAPTCTETGLTDGIKCSVCDEIILAQEVISATGHTEGEVKVENNVAPTCTEDGSYDEVVYCSVCDTELSRNTVVVEATGHTEGEVKVENNVDPTCTVNGSYDNVIYCSVCTVEISREKVEVSATGHSYVAVGTVDPTCTVDGYTTYTCSVCADSYEADIVPALGHSFTNYTSNNDAACEKDATETAECDRCDATDTRTVEGTALEHIFETYVSDDNATCLEDGTKTSVCKLCNTATHTVTEEGTAKGHIFENYVADGNATCIADGTKTSKCSRCDVTFTAPDKDSALGHDFTSYIYDGNATCTKNGTETSKCTRCSVKFTRAAVGTALGHDYTVEVGTTAGDCKHPATTTYKCERCDSTKVVEGALGECVVVEVKEYTVEPTCSAAGKYDLVKVCEVCGEEKSRTEDIDAPALDHNYVFISSKEGTCVTKYTLNYKCSMCDDIKVEIGDQFGNHSPKASKQENVKLPTCSQDGSYDMVTRCRYCNEVLNTTSYTVPATGHSFTVKVDRTAGDCQTVSSTTYKCQYCTETQVIEGQLGTHKKAERQENIVAATCATRGSYDKVTYCTVCNEELSRKTETTSKLKHASTEIRIENEIPATTTTTGSYEEVVFCEDCNTELSRVTVTIPVINNGSNSGSNSGSSSGSDSGSDSGSNSGSSSTGKLSIWEKLIAFFRSLLSIFGL